MLHNNVKQIEVSCLLFSSFQSQTPKKKKKLILEHM